MWSGLEWRVTQLVGKHLGCDPGAVTLWAHLVDDLHGDSLGLVQLHLALEEAFDVEISDEQALSLATVMDLISFLRASRR